MLASVIFLMIYFLVVTWNFEIKSSEFKKDFLIK